MEQTRFIQNNRTPGPQKRTCSVSTAGIIRRSAGARSVPIVYTLSTASSGSPDNNTESDNSFSRFDIVIIWICSTRGRRNLGEINEVEGAEIGDYERII
jgi:hypothetical protein